MILDKSLKVQQVLQEREHGAKIATQKFLLLNTSRKMQPTMVFNVYISIHFNLGNNKSILKPVFLLKLKTVRHVDNTRRKIISIEVASTFQCC